MCADRHPHAFLFSIAGRPILFAVWALLVLFPTERTAVAQAGAQQPAAPWAIEIHGGAGEAEWLDMDKGTADAYHASLARALAAGAAVLEKNGTALDAVQAAV